MYCARTEYGEECACIKVGSEVGVYLYGMKVTVI